MNNEIRTQFKRLDQPRRCHGRINQQGHAGVMSDRTDGRDIEDIQARISNGFTKKQAGVWPHRCLPGGMVMGRDKTCFDPKTTQGVVQQIVRTPVKRCAGNDMPAGSHQRRNREVQRSLTARGCDRADPALECRDALLEHRIRGVTDSTVNMPRALQIEQSGCMV